MYQERDEMEIPALVQVGERVVWTSWLGEDCAGVVLSLVGVSTNRAGFKALIEVEGQGRGYRPRVWVPGDQVRRG